MSKENTKCSIIVLKDLVEKIIYDGQNIGSLMFQSITCLTHNPADDAAHLPKMQGFVSDFLVSRETRQQESKDG